MDLIVARYSAGDSLQAIGDDLSITKERVRQLLVEAGYEVRALRAKGKQERYRRLREEHRSTIVEMLEQRHEPRDVARALGVPFVIVKGIDIGNPGFAEQRRINRASPLNSKRAFSDEDLIEYLLLASRDCDGILTTPSYREISRSHASSDGRGWPASQTIYVRFGSWSAALERAGLPSNPISPKRGRVVFDEAQCLRAILEVERALGRLPSSTEYSDYAGRSGGRLPSMSTIVHRVGGWTIALRSAVASSRRSR